MHLAPYTVRCLDASLYLIVQPHGIQPFPYRCCELIKDTFQVFLLLAEACLYLCVGGGLLVAKSQVLQFLLDFVKAESIGQWCVDIQRFASYLILLCGQLASQSAHSLQAVGYLDEDDTYVVAHRKQQFLEVLRLHRCLITEDASRYLCHTVHNLRYLRAEDVADVLHCVFRVLHHIVQQGSTYTGAPQSEFLRHDLGHRQRMHDIRLSGNTFYAFVSLTCKLECTLYEVYLLAMGRRKITFYQALICLCYSFFFHHLRLLYVLPLCFAGLVTTFGTATSSRIVSHFSGS